MSLRCIEREIRVPETMAGLRLDQALAQLLAEFSRGRLQAWIKARQVTVDGRILRARDRIKGGEQIVIKAELDESAAAVEPEQIALNVIYEDRDLLVINKEAGMVVHPAAGHARGTLQNALLYHSSALTALPRAGIVHRLDKLTSGIMVVAKTLEAHHSLVSQLQTRKMSRQYLALVHGVMPSGGSIEAPIGRHPVDRKRMAVVAAGKEATTHYRVHRRFRRHTLLEVKLESGRTHQIRVHMAYLRYPLVGDPVYGGRFKLPPGAGQELTEALQRFRRQALHAQTLALVHPRSNRPMRWSAPVPADMAALLELLAQDCGQCDNNENSG